MSDTGFQILLFVQLATSLVAMIAWGRFWQVETPAALRLAGAASACWFAVAAALIAYLFDVELVG